MKLIWIPLWAAGYIYFVWLFYLSLCSLKRALPKLDRTERLLAYPALILFMICDASLNFVIAPFLFLEFPHNILFTSTLERHIHEVPGSWRYDTATWFCEELLDKFDPAGKHCR